LIIIEMQECGKADSASFDSERCRMMRNGKRREARVVMARVNACPAARVRDHVVSNENAEGSRAARVVAMISPVAEG
jgi:hypothetical protein